MIIAFFCLHLSQFVWEVIYISIKESFFLNEIAEHQPVEHHRSIP